MTTVSVSLTPAQIIALHRAALAAACSSDAVAVDAADECAGFADAATEDAIEVEGAPAHLDR